MNGEPFKLLGMLWICSGCGFKGEAEQYHQHQEVCMKKKGRKKPKY